MSIIAGNWKMNLLSKEAEDLTKTLIDNNKKDNEVIIIPGFIHLSNISKILENSPIKLGSQDCHYAEKGAFTGDISAAQLKDYGCEYTLVGHSERRNFHNESNKIVSDKAFAAHKAAIKPIICIGESLENRQAEETESIIEEQLEESIPDGLSVKDFIIAYEPVWAIGTGLSASIDEISAVHNFIKGKLGNDVDILYGGSVNDENCQEILSIDSVSGLLVGGASLKSEKFSKIINS